MKCAEDFVSEMMEGYPHELVKGDFRKDDVQKNIRASLGDVVSVLSIDCNWPTSVEASLELTADKLVNGSIVYFDDYYVGTRSGDYMKPIMDKIQEKYGVRFLDFHVYPPCARAFVIEKV